MAGMLAMFVDLFQKIDFFSSLVDAGTTNPKSIVREAYQETELLIVDMCGNEGQLSVIENLGIPEFKKNKDNALEDEFEWEDVDLGDYMDFVGEIIAEGNLIMSEACEEAKELQEEIEEAIQDAAFDFLFERD